ncbi:S41 family peptidase [Chryseomicrobium palamuruense]|uniref:S41 family peptidase n=1 Tax=Chryseomicrobium palamuruense TaxID=682973 RepID=A0ABV8UVY5_9BACL
MEHQPEQQPEVQEQPPARKAFRINPFIFVIVLFLTATVSAGVTMLALTTGEEKVVEVIQPVERQEFSKLYDVYDELKSSYYSEFDQEELVNGAINGMVDALGDPYSDYMNVDEASQFDESISSSFQGIGAEIQERNGVITVVSPIKNSPAERAGIMPNDQILSVDGEDIRGFSASEAVLLIRGEKGTDVTLTIKRGEAQPIEVTITRDDIPIETVYVEMMDNGVAHIAISSFSRNTYQELLTALEEMEAKGMTSLLLDVRQNPGGLLDVAIDIASLFVAEGEPILQIEQQGQAETIPALGGEKISIPTAVIIDEGSASASEIIAAALNESADIPLIGLTTFGKGTVQSVEDLEDGSNIKLTTAKWLTPDGNWIHEKGVEPDYIVEYPSFASVAPLDASTELSLGLQSEAVTSLEQFMSALGFESGEQDGRFDEALQQAVMQFQEQNDLEPTGVVSGETTTALMDAIRTKLTEEDPQLLKAAELLQTNP